MEEHPSAEGKDTFYWPKGDFEEYVAGYKLYKQLKKKWDAIEKGENPHAVKQILGSIQ